ncbi:MAG TPA: hypothetical protein DEH02_07890 [Bacteroidales bacterium]|nr:MAG: hypothetical protein A2X01_04560 [Bacteroidetes bacterium GWF2_35_48]OFY95783.1 MAG: hypothetical protein A2491_15830 [Bacteroidetes bacterium RIFOXYC12_FULL_35_7]HBX50970.1 hypothetical protein [Bacteroidales bacterium]
MKIITFIRAIAITIVLLCSFINFSFAQFDWIWNGTGGSVPPNTFRFGMLKQNLDIRAIGIGNFTSTNRPLSALHVNTNLMGTDPDFNKGEVFRTDAPVGTFGNPIDINWRMYRGTNQVVRFYNPYSSFVPSTSGQKCDLIIETTMGRSNIIFGTATIPRMIIQDGTNPAIQTGLVGIGNNFLSPQSQLHINDGVFDTYTQITNAATGASANDGLRIGVLGSNGNAVINQQENQSMFFNTNNTARMQINESGLITVYSLASGNNSIVLADKNGTLYTTEIETILTQSQTIQQLKQQVAELEKSIAEMKAIFSKN